MDCIVSTNTLCVINTIVSLYIHFIVCLLVPKNITNRRFHSNEYTHDVSSLDLNDSRVHVIVSVFLDVEYL